MILSPIPRARVLDAIPLRDPRPAPLPRKRTIITRIEFLILRPRRKHRPLLKIRIHDGRAARLRHLPRDMVAREIQRLAQLLADARVDADPDSAVHGRVRHGAQDRPRHADAPADVVLGAVRPQRVFLRVIKVGLVGDARGGF